MQQLEELTKNLEGVNIWVKPGKLKRRDKNFERVDLEQLFYLEEVIQK